ncbi:MAG: DUF1844 domain-containing protein [Bdellovibrionales bacterium]|nr:DUF1844 domain-containing protein [Bdellovibrionales bacterium]
MNSISRPPIQKLDFTTFILSVSSASFMALQGEGGAGKPDLLMAKQNIDLLELMQEKTKGNLSPEESKLLEQLLFEVRIKFVEAQGRT